MSWILYVCCSTRLYVVCEYTAVHLSCQAELACSYCVAVSLLMNRVYWDHSVTFFEIYSMMYSSVNSFLFSY